MTQFALVDCNSFYASCEQVFRPDLVGKPTIVLSNNDGCVIARSKEAKQLGIKMGEPYFKREGFFKRNKVAIFSANFTLYGDFSSRVMQVLGNFTPDLEVYSIDEAFLDLSGFNRVTNYAQQIQKKVAEQVHIPTSIGVGETKTLAKLANHIAKKQEKFGGVYNLSVAKKNMDFDFQRLHVGKVWGIGDRYVKMLAKHGVYTVKDFMDTPENWIKQQMTVQGQRIHLELHGHSCIGLEKPSAKKNICTSRSFGQALQKHTEVEEALVTFTAVAARKLREQASTCKRLMVFVETNRFKPEPQYNNSMGIRLPYATNSTMILSQYARFVLKRLFQKGYNYKKVGIILSEFAPQEVKQLALNFPASIARKDKIENVSDSLASKYGKGIVKLASEGTKQPFKMRQNHKSPAYTTDWDAIPKVV